MQLPVSGTLRVMICVIILVHTRALSGQSLILFKEKILQKCWGNIQGNSTVHSVEGRQVAGWSWEGDDPSECLPQVPVLCPICAMEGLSLKDKQINIRQWTSTVFMLTIIANYINHHIIKSIWFNYTRCIEDKGYVGPDFPLWTAKQSSSLFPSTKALRVT